MNCKIFVKSINKQDAVGGVGGYAFDSGCNPTGVSKVHILCGEHFWIKKYLWATLRVFLEFRDSPTKHPTYHGWQKNSGTLHTFEVGPDDKITKVVVWADKICAHALQIHTKNGIISELYGFPNEDSKPHEFYGGHAIKDGDDIQIVGVHGRVGGLLDSLGFTFGTVVTPKSSFDFTKLESEMNECIHDTSNDDGSFIDIGTARETIK